MFSSRRHWLVCALGGLFLLWGTGPAWAGKLAFRNEGPAAVIVHSTVLVRGVPIRGKPLLINPGQAGSWDAMPSGKALITILDARAPTRPIYQGALLCGKDDQFFAIKPDPPFPRAKLEPIKPPMTDQ